MTHHSVGIFYNQMVYLLTLSYLWCSESDQTYNIYSSYEFNFRSLKKSPAYGLRFNS